MARIGAPLIIGGGPGRWLRRTYLSTPGAGVFVPQLTTRVLFVQLVGAGGGGGGCVASAAAQAAFGLPGGAGGYSEKTIAIAAGDTFAYVIGAGGLAGAAGNNLGGVGGTTSFGAAPLLQATGGGRGATSWPSGNSTILDNGGGGGVGSLGDLNYNGQDGLMSCRFGSQCQGGEGGSGPFGSGGPMRDTTGPGTVGSGFGTGGTAGVSIISQPAQAGAAGAPGLIVVMEYTG